MTSYATPATTITELTDYAAKRVEAALSMLSHFKATDLRRIDVHNRERDHLTASIRWFGSALPAEDRERALRAAFREFDAGLVRQHAAAEARTRLGARLEAFGAALRSGDPLPEDHATLLADLTALLAAQRR